MLVRQLQNDLPVPSDFAWPSVWPEAQEGASILCICPPNARGLPLILLYDVFLCFQQEMSGSPPNFKSGIERVVVTCQTTQLSLIDTELSVFYMYLSNNSTRYISIDNVQEMINYLPQPDRHRTKETNYSADETI